MGVTCGIAETPPRFAAEADLTYRPRSENECDPDEPHIQQGTVVGGSTGAFSCVRDG